MLFEEAKMDVVGVLLNSYKTTTHCTEQYCSDSVL